MTRSRSFILNTANTWINLYTLITSDPSFTNAFFNDGSEYMPSNLDQLRWQSQNALTNPANGGAVISVSLDGVLNNTHQSGEDVLSGGVSVLQGPLDVHQVWFMTSQSGAGINVSMVTGK